MLDHRNHVGLLVRGALSEQIGLSHPARSLKRLEMQNPFRYFNSSPEIIRLTVMMYVLLRAVC